MSRHPQPTRADHQAFCEIEGWTQVRNATGRSGHHVTYEHPLPDGRVLRTRISHPPDRSTDGCSLWSHILRDQFDVSADEFWACIQDRAVPERSAAARLREAIPASIVRQLLRHAIPESGVVEMNRQEAIARAAELWSQES